MSKDEVIAEIGREADATYPEAAWPLIVAFVAEWLDDLRNTSFSQDEADIAVRRWREDMAR